MAIRQLKKFEVRCDHHRSVVSEFRAFVTSEEGDILDNLVVICNSCYPKKYTPPGKDKRV